jgi:hypothetical protein
MTTHHQHEEDRSVGFDALIDKVRQAETALEAKERQTVAEYHQTRNAWRAMWTPGRIVLAGLVSGFVVGRAEPFKRAAGGGTLQLISALGSLFAGGSAQAAAGEAEQAADAAEAATGTAPGPGGARATVTRPVTAAAAAPQQQPAARQAPPYDVPETFRDSGQL